jgi:hypothetical protein
MKIPSFPFPDSKILELLEVTERSVERMRPHIAAANAVLTNRTFLEEATRMARALEGLEMKPLFGDIVKVGQDLEAALRFRDQAVLTVGQTLTASMSRLEAIAGPMQDTFSKILPAHDAVVRALNELARDWPQLQPFAFELERATREAPDEPTRQRWLAEHVPAFIEAAAGIDMELDTTHKRLALRYRLLVLLYLFIMWIQNLHFEARQETDIRDLRKVQLEQAETIAGLTTMAYELKSQLAQATHELVVFGRVTKRGVLRAAPNGETQSVMKVHPGQVLRIGMTIDRWYFVEVVDESHDRSVVKGWIYRRNVTILPSQFESFKRRTLSAYCSTSRPTR